MTLQPRCPRCQCEVATDAPGALCVRCLLGLGIEPPLPRAFGRYELLRRLDEGGMGVIFEARESNPDRLVALKMMRSGALATSEEREWFRREAQEASRLEHHNIVPIFHVGEADEPAYYTMRLMTGGTLADHREALRLEPRRAAHLLAAVARAVHHGHLRGILHRDLKPANILLDEEGQPHVADFGIATRLDDEDDTAGPLGTPHYMSPEQAGPRPRQLTTKSDVYSLGAILYELLTGRPPFMGTPEEILAQQRTATPRAPRSLDPDIDRDLEAICLNCLEKEPDRRLSTEQFAENLERFLRGDSVGPRPLGFFERAWRWSLRHPAAAGLASTVVLLLVALSSAAVLGPQAMERRLRKDALTTNSAAARYVAFLALAQLGGLRELTERLAANPLIVARLDGPPCGQFDPEIQALGARESLASIGLWDTTGARVARWPTPEQPLACDVAYEWCDHFKGAALRGREGRREGYIARASRSEVTGTDKFTIAAPVFDNDGRWRGVVYISAGTSSVLNHVQLDTGGDPNRTAALIARRDNTRETKDDPLPTSYVVLVHNGIEQGDQAATVQSTAVDKLPTPGQEAPQTAFTDLVLTDEHYRDPVPGFDGRWLAAFAPVGKTDYAVVVQTRYSAIDDQIGTLARLLLLGAGLPFLIGAVAINLLLFFFRRRAT